MPIAAASVEIGVVVTVHVVSPASTDSSPVRRPVGTTAVIDLLVQLVTVRGWPPSRTVPPAPNP